MTIHKPGNAGLRLGAAAVVLAALTSCGTSSPNTRAVDPAETTTSPTLSPTPAPAEPARATVPDNFVKQMASHGYVLAPAQASRFSVTDAAAIESAMLRYHLFSEKDPVTAVPYLVTTPTAGQLVDPTNANSSDVEKPEMDNLPMWVVYARAELPKDPNDPSLGMVLGTVISFVDATTGETKQAITY